jgi:hypothetical protein
MHRYRDFRDENGVLTPFFWKLLALRLFFVILFEVKRISLFDLKENILFINSILFLFYAV